MGIVNSADTLSSADDFRSLERTRLRSLVERDMNLASELHSPEFHLVTPGGVTRSRESYLARELRADVVQAEVRQRLRVGSGLRQPPEEVGGMTCEHRRAPVALGSIRYKRFEGRLE